MRWTNGSHSWSTVNCSLNSYPQAKGKYQFHKKAKIKWIKLWDNWFCRMWQLQNLGQNCSVCNLSMYLRETLNIDWNTFQFPRCNTQELYTGPRGIDLEIMLLSTWGFVQRQTNCGNSEQAITRIHGLIQMCLCGL